jgi:hypothetical protein
MPVPTVDPADLEPADIAPADSYQPGDRVWVYRSGCWRAGVIVAASARAATVTYRPANLRGTAVDTLTAEHLIARVDLDPLLDAAPRSLLDAAPWSMREEA